MKTIQSKTLEFLKELKLNNDREWFNDNKSSYQEAMDNFKEFTDSLILQIGTFDKDVLHLTSKETVFRIYRDVRFSKDKSPYKTHFGAHITSAKSRSELHTKAGYYIHLEPGGTMLAGGAYLPESKWLKAIRQEIHFNASELKRILDDKEFKKYFKNMEGEKLKTSPRDYPADHPEIELLKHKSFLASHLCEDSQAISDNFMEHCKNVFKALYPFDTFLNQAQE